MKNIKKLPLIASLLSLLVIFTPANADVKVVTSIKPIHSLASYLMDGVGKPDLIVDGYASPHGFALKPSHAKMLQNADLIFWVGEDLENFLEKPLKSIAKKAEKIELMEIKGLNKLKFRERNIFEGHDDHGHAHGEYDPHIWLDPHNAEVMVEEIANQLAAIDPQNADAYKKNSKNAIDDIEKLIKETKKEMKKGISYIVFHDAYQYFEKEFNVSALGALTLNTDVAPGAKQISEIKEIIEHENVKCLFSEPQFNPDIIKSIAKGTNVKVGVLDPLGANLENGKELYFKLIKDISSSLKKC